ncbi:hypothetical protein TELCIR_08256, partial [Teladorsagia circumcincta]
MSILSIPTADSHHGSNRRRSSLAAFEAHTKDNLKAAHGPANPTFGQNTRTKLRFELVDRPEAGYLAPSIEELRAAMIADQQMEENDDLLVVPMDITMNYNEPVAAPHLPEVAQPSKSSSTQPSSSATFITGSSFTEKAYNDMKAMLSDTVDINKVGGLPGITDETTLPVAAPAAEAFERKGAFNDLREEEVFKPQKFLQIDFFAPLNHELEEQAKKEGDEEEIYARSAFMGGFAKVYKAIDEEGKTLALKVTDAYVFTNASVLFNEYHSYGTLLDLSNKLNDPSWYIILLIAIQMGKILRDVHSTKIIHGDVKPDNFMVLNKLNEGCEEADRILDTPVVKLIDWGRAIDMRALPGQTFTGRAGTDRFDCSEMM